MFRGFPISPGVNESLQMVEEKIRGIEVIGKKGKRKSARLSRERVEFHSLEQPTVTSIEQVHFLTIVPVDNCRSFNIHVFRRHQDKAATF